MIDDAIPIRRLLAGLAICAALMVGTSGCGHSGASQSSGEPTAAHPGQTGSTEPLIAVDSSVTDPRLLISGRMVVPAGRGADSQPHGRGYVASVDTSSLNGPSAVAAQWQAGLEALSHRRKVAWVGITADPQSVYEFSGDAFSLAWSGRTSSTSAARLRARAIRAAGRLELGVVAATVRRTGAGPALVLVLSTSDGDARRYQRARRTLTAFLGLRDAAALVEVVDQHGRVILADGLLPQSPVELSWSPLRAWECIGVESCLGRQRGHLAS